MKCQSIKQYKLSTKRMYNSTHHHPHTLQLAGGIGINAMERESSNTSCQLLIAIDSEGYEYFYTIWALDKLETLC